MKLKEMWNEVAFKMTLWHVCALPEKAEDYMKSEGWTYNTVEKMTPTPMGIVPLPALEIRDSLGRTHMSSPAVYNRYKEDYRAAVHHAFGRSPS